MKQIIGVRQLKAARALLGLHQGKLAELAGVSLGTVNNFERGEQENCRMKTLEAITWALEAEGVEFISGEGGAIGLWFRKKERVHTVLIVGRNGRARKLYRSWLSGKGKERCRVVEAINIHEASQLLAHGRLDCVVFDAEVCDDRAFEWLKDLRDGGTAVPALICSLGMLSEGLRRKAMGAGVAGCYDRSYLKEEGLSELVRRVFR
jgi:transcriptional regulator with XRE-family HTH domain